MVVLILFNTGTAFQCMIIVGQSLWQRKFSSQSLGLERVRMICDLCDLLSLSLVPVIAIFTKFDALHTVAFGELREQGKGIQEALAMAPKHAEQVFKNNDYCGMLQAKEFPPKNFVCMGGELLFISHDTE